MKSLLCALALLIAAAGTGIAAPVDDVAAVLASASLDPLTADSLPAEFARLTHLVRHDANGMALFTQQAPADGHVRNAQAQFDTMGASRPQAGQMPLYSAAFELVDQPDFNFEGLAAAMEQKLGPPAASSNQPGAVFRTWTLKEPKGRSVTLARSPGSDNGEMSIIVQIVQNR